jgi:divalent metal cation (Fe/Co/Zn/Cd) transporter
MPAHTRALRLEYFTVGYNLLEAAAAIGFGAAAASIALVGFGLDSIVESLSGLILIWRLADSSALTHEQVERKETLAVKFVGASFLVLGAYVAWEAVGKLLAGHAPAVSIPGIVVAAMSLLVMPVLARAKRREGLRIGSRALLADAKETLACAWLSVALLLGLGANAAVGFWQADPLAGLVITFFLFREGWEHWNGEECDDDCDEET